MLTETELLGLIESTETFRIEKTISTTDTDKFCQAICAFSNDMPDSRKPGYLLLGVTDDNRRSGLRVSDDLLKSLAGLRTDGNILPLPSMTVQHFSFPDGDVIAVEVQPSIEPPVRFRGRTWIRIGPRKDTATPTEEIQLAEKRQSFNRSFDMSPCMDASIDDLDIDLFLKHYLPNAVSEDVLVADDRNVIDKMFSLRLFDKRYNRPTNAAVLLFGKNPGYFFPGDYIQYVEFDGTDNAGEIANQNEFGGNLVTMLPRLKTFIETSLVKKKPVPISLLQEKTVSNYPEWAIRELMMNAVMHRDYQGNTPVKLYAYSDRLEITNPGGLYGNARPENFPEVNDYRNPIIAEALKVLGYVNKYNRGIARVQKELHENGNGEALFTLNKVTVFAVKVKRSDNLTNGIAAETNLSNIIIYNHRVPKSIPDGMTVLSYKSLRILTLCSEKAISKSVMFEKLGITPQTNNVKLHLSPLVDMGLVRLATETNLSNKEKTYVITSKGLDLLNEVSKKRINFSDDSNRI